jgi:hypothetical protein
MRLLLRQGRSEAEPGLRRRATPAATLGCTPRAALAARCGVGRGDGLGGTQEWAARGKGGGWVSLFPIFLSFLSFFCFYSL